MADVAEQLKSNSASGLEGGIAGKTHTIKTNSRNARLRPVLCHDPVMAAIHRATFATQPVHPYNRHPTAPALRVGPPPRAAVMDALFKLNQASKAKWPVVPGSTGANVAAKQTRVEGRADSVAGIPGESPIPSPGGSISVLPGSRSDITHAAESSYYAGAEPILPSLLPSIADWAVPVPSNFCRTVLPFVPNGDSIDTGRHVPAPGPREGSMASCEHTSSLVHSGAGLEQWPRRDSSGGSGIPAGYARGDAHVSGPMRGSKTPWGYPGPRVRPPPAVANPQTDAILAALDLPHVGTVPCAGSGVQTASNVKSAYPPLGQMLPLSSLYNGASVGQRSQGSAPTYTAGNTSEASRGPISTAKADTLGVACSAVLPVVAVADPNEIGLSDDDACESN